MAGRVQQLTSAKAGISRLKVKGGADRESLYDLLNGYVDSSGSIVSRPGTVEDATLPAGTHGLMAFDDAMKVFASSVKTGMPAGYTCEVLSHPTDPTQDIVEIHFSAPFLGYPYVVAEFTSGDVFHYWLQAGTAWTAETFFKEGDVIVPTTPNGLAYRAKRIGPAAPLWAPDVARAIGDKVEPTTANGYQYTVIDTVGDNPRSGTVEPDWPAADGATVNEDADTTPAETSTATTGTDLPDDINDRYRRDITP